MKEINARSLSEQDSLLSVKNGVLTIPEGIEKISAISSLNKLDIREIRLPNGLKTIGNGAFAGCKNLEKIIFPDSIEKIGDYAFCDCTSLKEVEIPSARALSSFHIGEGSFMGCDELIRFSSRKDVVSVSKFAFSNCKNLREFKVSSPLGGKTVFVNDHAFENCKFLNVFPTENLFHVGMFAFSGCDYLSPTDRDVIASLTFMNDQVDKKDIEFLESFISPRDMQNLLVDGITQLPDGFFRRRPNEYDNLNELPKINIPISLSLQNGEVTMNLQDKFRPYVCMKTNQPDNGLRPFYEYVNKEGIVDVKKIKADIENKKKSMKHLQKQAKEASREKQSSGGRKIG